MAIRAAAALATLVTIWYVLWLYLPSFNTTRSPLDGVGHAPSARRPTPGLARRLVVLIVDGVSYSVVRSLDELLPLRRAGVLRPLVVEFPSYTDPAITSFVTGLDPVDSGMRLNGKTTGAVGLDAVTIAAADAGVPVKVRSRGWEEFEHLIRARGADVSHSQVRFQAELTAAGVKGWPALAPIDGASPARELVVAYVVDADKAAHHHGMASPEFSDASHLAASLVARYASTLDLEQDALVVVSDHGHLVKGGHGGAEPEILRSFFLAAGPFVRRGVELGERPLRDVASTLSVLAGLRVPSSNLGRPMLDAMTLDDEQRSFVLAAPFEAASRLLCALAPSPRCSRIEPLVDRLQKADPTAWIEAESLLDGMIHERRVATATSWERRARLRLGLGLAFVVAAAAALFLRRRHAAREALKLLALPALHATLYGAGLFVLGYTASFSSLKTQPMFYRDAAYASVVAIVITLLVARAWRAGTLAPWVILGATFTPIALLAAWVGCDPRDVPPPTEGILLLEIAPMVLSAGLLAVFTQALRKKSEAVAAAAPPRSASGTRREAAAAQR